MDQIDHTSSIDIQQQALSEMMKQNPANDLSYLFSINCKIQNLTKDFAVMYENYLDSDQLNPENHDNNVSLAQSSNAEYEQDENDQLSMPIVYRKRVRTKFNREQVFYIFLKNLLFTMNFTNILVRCIRINFSTTSLSNS